MISSVTYTDEYYGCIWYESVYVNQLTVFLSVLLSQYYKFVVRKVYLPKISLEKFKHHKVITKGDGHCDAWTKQ